MTEHEHREADALIAAWEQACVSTREYGKTRNDIDELLRACYGTTQETVVSITSVLRTITHTIQRIGGEWNKTVESFMEEYLRTHTELPEEMPKKLERKMKELLRPLKAISDNDPSLNPFIQVLMALIGNNRLESANYLCSLQENHANRLDGVVSAWREAQKRVRQHIAENEVLHQNARTALLHALRIWASTSDARMAYVRERGVPVSHIVSNGISPASPCLTPSISHRRKKQHAINNGGHESTECSGASSDNRTWRIVCVNREKTEIASYELLPDDDGSELEKLIEREFGSLYAWRGRGIRVTQFLRKLLECSPDKRRSELRLGSFKIEGNLYLRKKFGRRYRLLVRVNDSEESPSVLLIAGHRTELYSEIRGFKGSEK